MAMMNVLTRCGCGDETTLKVRTQDYQRWRMGEYIQNAFPYLSAGDRERLKTGICPKCWDKMFAEPEF